MLARDPLKELQYAAARAAEHTSPGDRAERVVVFGVGGSKLLEAAVPACCCGAEKQSQAQTAPAGWVVTDLGARFDGRAIGVATSRLKLLRVLVEADSPLSGKELAKLAFDRETGEDNARYHVKILQGELKAAFPDFEGEIITSDGGYRLRLR